MKNAPVFELSIPTVNRRLHIFLGPKLAADIAPRIAISVSLKYPLDRSRKVLAIPASQDAGQVSAGRGEVSRGAETGDGVAAGRCVSTELMSEKGQLVTRMFW